MGLLSAPLLLLSAEGEESCCITSTVHAKAVHNFFPVMIQTIVTAVEITVYG